MELLSTYYNWWKAATNMIKTSVLVLMNQLLGENVASGGEVRAAAILKNIKRDEALDPLTVVPEPLKELQLKKSVFTGSHKLTEKLLRLKNFYSVYLIIPAYIFRTTETLVKIGALAKLDHVYSTGDFLCNTLPAFVIKILNPKSRWHQCIYHINKGPFSRKPVSFFRNTLSYVFQRSSFLLILLKADTIICLNSEVSDFFKTKGFRGKIFRSTIGVEPELIDKTELSVPKKDTITFVGRINPSKGVFDLPAIIAKVLLQSPEARLTLIGEYQEDVYSKLSSLFAEAGLVEKVEFTGFLKQEEMYRKIAESKVFISPSYEEGFGIAVMEALACNTAVVAYELPVYKEFPKEGLHLVTLGDTQTFAAKVIKLLKNQKTDQPTKKYSKNSMGSWEETYALERKVFLA